MRHWQLIVATVVGAVAFTCLLFFGFGRRIPEGETEYQVKREAIAPLQRLRGARPFSPQEMQLLRRFVYDPDWRIRCRAL